MTRSLAVLAVALSSLGAVPGGQAELEGRFATGTMVTTPSAGAHCRGSIAALGTSNIAASTASGVLSGKATTVVNVWAIRRSSDGSGVGYVVKTFDGALWYEPPVEGLRDQALDDVQSHVLANQPLTFTSCFRGDLPL